MSEFKTRKIIGGGPSVHELSTGPEGNKDVKVKEEGLTEKETVHQQMMKRWDNAFSHWTVIYAEIDKDFQMVRGDQWEEEAARQRRDQGRPVLNVNYLHPICRKVSEDVYGNLRLNRVKPTSGNHQREEPVEMRVINGLLRFIESSSSGMSAIENAIDQQCIGGLGFWRIENKYVSDDFENVDIDLMLTPILSYRSVYFDPSTIHQTMEDAGYCFVANDIKKDVFEERWPDAVVQEFSGTDSHEGDSSDYYGGWKTENEDTIRIVEYFWKETKSRLIALDSNGEVHDVTGRKKKEILEEYGEDTRLHKRISWRVRRAIATNTEILEMQDWPGQYIPIVPVAGFRYMNKGVPHYGGMVRWARDAQRIMNYSFSSMMETLAREGLGSIIAAEESVQEYAGDWNNIHSRDILRWRARSVEGQQDDNPAPNWVGPPPASNTAVLSAQTATSLLHDSSGVTPHYLGEQSNIRSKSGREDANLRTQVGTVTKLVRSLEQSVGYSGRILIDLFPHFYDTKRTIRIMQTNGELEDLEINQETSGLQTIDIANLSKTKHKFTLVQEAPLDTRRSEASQILLELVTRNPEMMNTIGDVFVNMLDHPLLGVVSDRLRNLVPLNVLSNRELSEEEKAHIAQQQKQEQELQKEATKVQLGVEQGRIGLMQAQAAKHQTSAITDAMKASADTEKIMAEIMQINAQLKDLGEKIDK